MQFTTDGEFWRLILGRNPNLYMGLPPWPVHSLVKKLLEACVLLASMLPMQFTTGWKFCRSTLGCKSKLHIGLPPWSAYSLVKTSASLCFAGLDATHAIYHGLEVLSFNIGV